MKFIFWLLRKFNDGEPSIYEISYYFSKYNYTPRFIGVIIMYMSGKSIDDIAKEVKVPRERIRQMLRVTCMSNRWKLK